MKKMYMSILAGLVMAMLIAAFPGCKEGPLERAGKSVDKAAEKTGDKIKEVTK